MADINDTLREALTVSINDAIMEAVEATCTVVMNDAGELPTPDSIGYITKEILKDFAGRPSKVWIPESMTDDQPDMFDPPKDNS